jgi:hypothetical protein
MTTEQQPSYAVGDVVSGRSYGTLVALAKVTAPGLAMCSYDSRTWRCPTPIQRTSKGDLADGVRAHYKTVHPERGVQ